MRTLALALAAGLSLLVLNGTAVAAERREARSGALKAEEVASTIRRVADWQLANPVPFDPRHWAIAPLYDGLIDVSLTTGDPKYLAAVVRAGRRIEWEPEAGLFHADSLAAGHAWLRIYLMDRSEPQRLQPFKRRVDAMLRGRVTEELSFTTMPRTPGVHATDRWTWSDALYMAPPTLGLLAKATGDERYLKFSDAEFKQTYDTLFDDVDKLFYRDARYIGVRTANGEKLFWSRGNGWVHAGLPLFIESLPRDYPNRQFYVELFREMSRAVARAQQPDGLWRPSLKDPEQIPVGETSGSALFVLGLASGIRQGLLDRDTYLPVVERGWKALLTRADAEGAVHFVQPIGAAPEEFDPSSRQAFGTGAFLMAGAEVLRLLRPLHRVEPSGLLRRAEALVAQAPELSSRINDNRALSSGAIDRAYSVQVLARIAEPVLVAASKGELKARLPVHAWEKKREAWTHYEALARTLAGIAPWLELGPDATPEGKLRARFIELARQSLINATDPASADYMNFGQVPDQPLVESAYLAYALLTAPRQLWDPLTTEQKGRVLDALRTSLKIENKHDNNWVLFPAMIEAALLERGGGGKSDAIDFGVRKMDGWYLGDGVYGDGPQFHWDYYNSYVIHPMLLQVLRVAREQRLPVASFEPAARTRAERYGEVLERLISPEGTYPVFGRSSAYRFAMLFHLAELARTNTLPRTLERGAVRAGMTAVLRRTMEPPETFDAYGWLTLGAVGEQPGLQESYNATGSLYVCLTGLVHLGLPANDPFWTAPAASWTQRKIWSAADVPRDQALKGTPPTSGMGK